MIKQISTYNGSSWSTYDIGLNASNIKLTNNIYGVSSSTGTVQDVMSSWLPSSTIPNGQLIGTDNNGKLTGVNIGFTELGYIQGCSSSIETILISLKNTFQDFENINLIDKIYPIDSIYVAYNNTDPSTLFGGTWQVMSRTDNKPFYLLGSGGTLYSGDTGGTNSLTLTTNNLPQVTGSFEIRGFRTTSTNATIWSGSGLFTTTGNVAQSSAVNNYYKTSVSNPYRTYTFTIGSSTPIEIDPVNVGVVYWIRVA